MAASRRIRIARAASTLRIPRSRSRSTPVAFGLPPHPLRYAVLATLGVGIGLTILSAISTLATVLIYIGLAGFLALALEPVILLLTTRGRLPRWLAATLVAVGLAALFVGVMFAVIPTATEQLRQLFTALTDLARTLPDQPWFIWLEENAGTALDLDGMLGAITAFLSDPANLLTIAGGLLQVGTGIVEGATGAMVVTVLTIYLTATLPRVKTKAYQLLPASSRSRSIGLIDDILNPVGRYVGGQVLLALANALVTLLLTSILGSPSPVLLAVVAFIGALIPVIGTVFGSLIAVLATLAVSPLAALIAAIVLLIYMQVEAYVLSPRIMSRAVAIPGALVIVAAIAGAALGGVLGALLAVPVAAAGLTLLNRVVLPRQARR